MTCGRKIGPYDCCTVVCGDCLELMKAIPDGAVDAVITDPQYQLANGQRPRVTHQSTSPRFSKGVRLVNRIWEKPLGDSEPFSPLPFLRFPRVVLWGAIHYSDQLPRNACWLVWDKRVGVEIDDNADCEMAWTNLGGPARIYRQLWKGICREGIENIAIEGKRHPHQKPLAMMLWCIKQAGMPETILDPFAGSGTTGVAAKKLGRHFLLFEISEEYCRIARERIARVEAQPSLFAPPAEQLRLGT